jgi:Protein of unknown function (DUF3500)
MKPFNRARLAVVLGVLVCGAMGSTIASQRTGATMATSATAFLASLTPEQREKAEDPLNSPDRTHWNFIPTNMFPRQGLPLKEMTEPQRKLAHDLLKSGLSQRGYTVTTAIMNDLEAILRDTEAAARAAKPNPGGGAGNVRDPELYFFTVFGAPGPKGTWGWRVEGHHISLHFTIANGNAVVGAPSFWGTNPAEVREGPKKGFRALDREQDAGRALMMALDAEQQKTALFAEVAPNDILTKTDVVINPLSPTGVMASAMTSKQRELLNQLIEVYTSQMTADVAAERQAEIKKGGLDKIAFAWAGPVAPGEKHYYRVQGPTFVIEFDNTQNNGNHIHSVWRDFDSDFGRDLLREHLAAVAH